MYQIECICEIIKSIKSFLSKRGKALYYWGLDMYKQSILFSSKKNKREYYLWPHKILHKALTEEVEQLEPYGPQNIFPIMLFVVCSGSYVKKEKDNFSQILSIYNAFLLFVLLKFFLNPCKDLNTQPSRNAR